MTKKTTENQNEFMPLIIDPMDSPKNANTLKENYNPIPKETIPESIYTLFITALSLNFPSLAKQVEKKVIPSNLKLLIKLVNSERAKATLESFYLNILGRIIKNIQSPQEVKSFLARIEHKLPNALLLDLVNLLTTFLIETENNTNNNTTNINLNDQEKLVTRKSIDCLLQIYCYRDKASSDAIRSVPNNDLKNLRRIFFRHYTKEMRRESQELDYSENNYVDSYFIEKSPKHQTTTKEDQKSFLDDLREGAESYLKTSMMTGVAEIKQLPKGVREICTALLESCLRISARPQSASKETTLEWKIEFTDGTNQTLYAPREAFALFWFILNEIFLGENIIVASQKALEDTIKSSSKEEALQDMVNNSFSDIELYHSLTRLLSSKSFYLIPFQDVLTALSFKTLLPTIEDEIVKTIKADLLKILKNGKINAEEKKTQWLIEKENSLYHVINQLHENIASENIDKTLKSLNKKFGAFGLELRDRKLTQAVENINFQNFIKCFSQLSFPFEEDIATIIFCLKGNGYDHLKHLSSKHSGTVLRKNLKTLGLLNLSEKIKDLDLIKHCLEQNDYSELMNLENIDQQTALALKKYFELAYLKLSPEDIKIIIRSIITYNFSTLLTLENKIFGQHLKALLEDPELDFKHTFSLSTGQKALQGIISLISLIIPAKIIKKQLEKSAKDSALTPMDIANLVEGLSEQTSEGKGSTLDKFIKLPQLQKLPENLRTAFTNLFNVTDNQLYRDLEKFRHNLPFTLMPLNLELIKNQFSKTKQAEYKQWLAFRHDLQKLLDSKYNFTEAFRQSYRALQGPLKTILQYFSDRVLTTEPTENDKINVKEAFTDLIVYYETFPKLSKDQQLELVDCMTPMLEIGLQNATNKAVSDKTKNHAGIQVHSSKKTDEAMEMQREYIKETTALGTSSDYSNHLEKSLSLLVGFNSKIKKLPKGGMLHQLLSLNCFNIEPIIAETITVLPSEPVARELSRGSSSGSLKKADKLFIESALKLPNFDDRHKAFSKAYSLGIDAGNHKFAHQIALHCLQQYLAEINKKIQSSDLNYSDKVLNVTLTTKPIRLNMWHRIQLIQAIRESNLNNTKIILDLAGPFDFSILTARGAHLSNSFSENDVSSFLSIFKNASQEQQNEMITQANKLIILANEAAIEDLIESIKNAVALIKSDIEKNEFITSSVKKIYLEFNEIDRKKISDIIPEILNNKLTSKSDSFILSAHPSEKSMEEPHKKELNDSIFKINEKAAEVPIKGKLITSQNINTKSQRKNLHTIIGRYTINPLREPTNKVISDLLFEYCNATLQIVPIFDLLSVQNQDLRVKSHLTNLGLSLGDDRSKHSPDMSPSSNKLMPSSEIKIMSMIKIQGSIKEEDIKPLICGTDQVANRNAARRFCTPIGNMFDISKEDDEIANILTITKYIQDLDKDIFYDIILKKLIEVYQTNPDSQVSSVILYAFIKPCFSEMIERKIKLNNETLKELLKGETSHSQIEAAISLRTKAEIESKNSSKQDKLTTSFREIQSKLPAETNIVILLKQKLDPDTFLHKSDVEKKIIIELFKQIIDTNKQFFKSNFFEPWNKIHDLEKKQEAIVEGTNEIFETFIHPFSENKNVPFSKSSKPSHSKSASQSSFQMHSLFANEKKSKLKQILNGEEECSTKAIEDVTMSEYKDRTAELITKLKKCMMSDNNNHANYKTAAVIQIFQNLQKLAESNQTAKVIHGELVKYTKNQEGCPQKIIEALEGPKPSYRDRPSISTLQ